MEAFKTVEKEGYVLNIYYDENSEESPRDWDTLGDMLVKDNCRYLKNEYGSNVIGFDNKEQDEKELNKIGLYLPLYIYDHSVVSISTAPFGCRWDSGQVGYILVDFATIKKEFSCKYITKKIKSKVYDILEGEVALLNTYFHGEVYGFEITKNEESLDSCWGFYGQTGIEDIEADFDNFVDNARKEEHPLFEYAKINY